MQIAGILVLNAHKVTDTTGEGFALRLYRAGNKRGFVRAISDRPVHFSHGFAKVSWRVAPSPSPPNLRCLSRVHRYTCYRVGLLAFVRARSQSLVHRSVCERVCIEREKEVGWVGMRVAGGCCVSYCKLHGVTQVSPSQTYASKCRPLRSATLLCRVVKGQDVSSIHDQ